LAKRKKELPDNPVTLKDLEETPQEIAKLQEDPGEPLGREVVLKVMRLSFKPAYREIAVRGHAYIDHMTSVNEFGLLVPTLVYRGLTFTPSVDEHFPEAKTEKETEAEAESRSRQHPASYILRVSITPNHSLTDPNRVAANLTEKLGKHPVVCSPDSTSSRPKLQRDYFWWTQSLHESTRPHIYGDCARKIVQTIDGVIKNYAKAAKSFRK
jgi:hypothetical protein|tara:strand:- start:1109 stop:1741 length:633 start_codon:yes stop_codon:yes gene_type:complete